MDHELVLAVPAAWLGWAVLSFMGFLLTYTSTIFRTRVDASNDQSPSVPPAAAALLVMGFVLAVTHFVVCLIVLRKLYTPPNAYVCSLDAALL
ncbi:hypothetical protein OBBRIDRAFT_797663 [Obba rivulosa]|uniref:Uncharacterized protein n=1 Tax=Obba rivulosa TaxID=1052685 RepID=A0A8E2DHK1_9APHY|nr:hypothetical protein OBBRIDRAFT_797663 [Obba rivulosa]